MKPTVLEALARRLSAARGRVCALTGAGISVPSGIPDFRSPDGLWRRFPPQRTATLEAFHHRPEEFWAMIRAIYSNLAKAQPNPAHRALAKLEELGLLEVIATQNIDGLHQAAGSPSVLELHGHGRELCCLHCGLRRATRDTDRSKGPPPRCERCQNNLKPTVVMFGEALPSATWRAAERHAQHCELWLVIGTSGQVEPAASLPRIAARHGAEIAVLDLAPEAFEGDVAYRLAGSVDLTLPALLAAITAPPA